MAARRPACRTIQRQRANRIAEETNDVDIGQWLALISICLLGAMSPGPSLAVVMGCVVGAGRGAGYRAALAHGLAVALYGLLTVTGLALLITQTPALYTGLQVAGALYLLYLGVKSLRQVALASQAGEDATPAASAAMQGFLVAFLNPKLAVFMLALFSQFIDPGFGVGEKAIMVATVGVTDAGWYSLVVALVSRPGFRARLERSAKAIDGFFGVILIALALSVLYGALL